MPKRNTPFQRRGKYLNVHDPDRILTLGQRHYRNIQRMKSRCLLPPPPSKSDTQRITEPPVFVEFPMPPEEHYYLVFWTQIRLDENRLRELQRHLKRRLRVLDSDGCIILIENTRKETFPRVHFPNNRYVTTEYRAADLPFDSIPDPL